MNDSQHNHLPIVGHLGYFQFFSLLNIAMVNFFALSLFCILVISLGFISEHEQIIWSKELLGLLTDIATLFPKTC